MIFISLLCASFSIAAAQSSFLHSAKLLTQEVGWAASNEDVFLTTNGGSQWQNITPHSTHKWQAISSVFFLNPSQGWVLLHCGDGLNTETDDICFEFASTSDSGKSWSITHPKIADPIRQTDFENWTGFSGTTFLEFTDAQHGWAVLKRTTNVLFSSGSMLHTSDGGKTWIQLPDPPLGEHFHFVDANDGWLANSDMPNELFVTHDAGNSWLQVRISPPSEARMSRNFYTGYQLPVFDKTERGLLIVEYSDDLNSAVVLFSTPDLGRTWAFERLLPNATGIRRLFGQLLVDVSTTQSLDTLTFQLLPLSSPSPQFVSTVSDVHSIPIRHYNLGVGYDALGLVDESHAWLLADELLATSDGGTTWVDISPVRRSSSPEGLSASQPTKVLGNSTDLASASGVLRKPNSEISLGGNLGFDKKYVPDAAAMSEWWTSSPYYNVHIYLPHAPNGPSDPILSSTTKGPAWIASVQKQGWGVVPTWVGAQPACAACSGPYCVKGQYSTLIPEDVTSAEEQGAAEADAAVAQAQNSLQLSTSIIYKDIENYYGNTNLCTSAEQQTAALSVQAFLSGWDNELNNVYNYSAGVYGNPKPALADFSQASPMPNDVWIAQSPGPGGFPNVSIFNLGSTGSKLCDPSSSTCSLWVSQQRMHQFLTKQVGVSFGGYTPNEIDDDIDFAALVPGIGNKEYTYTYIALPDYGTAGTEPNGINDMASGKFISGPNSFGEVVGNYYNSGETLAYGHGFSATQTGSDWSYDTIDCPSGTDGTDIQGINNAGKVVGFYEIDDENEDYPTQAFWSLCTPIRNRGTFETEGHGINDASWIVGGYDLHGEHFGFIDYLPNPAQSIEFLSGPNHVSGINGLGQMVGYYLDTNQVATPVGFFYDGIAVLSTFSYPNATSTMPLGINNDGQIVGTWAIVTQQNVLEAAGGFICLPADCVAQNFTPINFPSAPFTSATGINDFGQIVGYYTDADGADHGFIAVPDLEPSAPH